MSGHRDPRVDAYIEQAAPFARPILEHVRRIVHDACPDVAETMKWNTPSFEFQGLLCSMAAFTAHCTLGFWKGEVLAPSFPALTKGGASLVRLGPFRSVRDLPAPTVLRTLVRAAAALNAQGVQPVRTRRPVRTSAVRAPADLRAALQKDTKARASFGTLRPSHKREYVEWITEAKRDETRQKRIATTIEWLREGKSRNWKYER